MAIKMTKEIAIGKRAKISQAQQYMFLAVLGAAICLGVGVSLIVHFFKQITFSANVISAEDGSIVNYSNIIRDTGICESPKGSTYSDDELTRCNPDSISVSKIPDTLRFNILTKLASNKALNSVPKESSSSCIDPKTNKNYTYKELRKLYDDASSSSELVAASQRIKRCSALRVIPDALPSSKNEEALLASLNKLFKESDWEPESLSPTGEISVSPLGNGTLNTISVKLAVEANTRTTMSVLGNIERSIREFDISNATIEWDSNDTLLLNAQATAYFTNQATLKETNKTMKAEGK